VGNKADVSSNDLLEYWEQDAATRLILLYLESFGNPRRFARLARRVGRRKPIVVVKSGRTRAGLRAATSHTAAIATSDVAVDALFHQTGVIRTETIDQLFDVAVCLETQPLPPGKRVGIVTNAGGPAILASDACEAAGLELAQLSSGLQASLAASLPGCASAANPVDLVASAGPEAYRRSIELLLAASEIDALIVMYTPVVAAPREDILKSVQDGIAAGRRAGGAHKPVLACVLPNRSRMTGIAVGTETVPVFEFPENAVQALGHAAQYAAWRARPVGRLWDFDDMRTDDGRAICRGALAAGRTWLTVEQVRGVLSACGLPHAAGTLASSVDQAVAAAKTLGFPVAAKLIAASLVHKSDVGGVRLNLSAVADVREAFGELVDVAQRAVPGETIDGVLIQPMVSDGIETIVGMTRDPTFGSLLAFGLGGIFAEALGDVQVKVGPVTDKDVDEMLQGIKGRGLLQGARGRPPADVGALREVLLRVSRLADDIPEIQDLDLNPVMALADGRGCRIVDARIRVGDRRVSAGPAAAAPSG
jgi:acyl-CoA synthetase (NDP forming)